MISSGMSFNIMFSLLMIPVLIAALAILFQGILMSDKKEREPLLVPDEEYEAQY